MAGLYPTTQSIFSRTFTEFYLQYKKCKKSDEPIPLKDYLALRILENNLTRLYHSLSERASFSPLEADDFRLLEEAYREVQVKTQKATKHFFARFSVEPSSKSDATPLSGLMQTSAREPHLFFGAIHSHPAVDCFDLDYPCRFEFGGIVYPSARHAFIAQMYQENRALQELCAAATGEQLLRIVAEHGNPCRHWWTPTADFSQYREEIMAHVLRAKFGQNPALQERLLATLDTFLVPTASSSLDDRFWYDGKGGQGAAKLGELLMKTRAYYGGIGIPEFSTETERACKTMAEKRLRVTGIESLDKADDVILAEIDALNRADTGDLYERETSICRKDMNRPFNRHNNCNLVWDRTLVPLSSGRYINANFLFDRLMIGTQSPLPHTRADFWQMILDQNSRVIVMLNYVSDFGGHFYAPEHRDAPHYHGDIEVHLIEEPTFEISPNWRQSPHEEEFHAIKKCVLEVRKDAVRHRVIHLQYVNWRDMGVGHPECVARIVEKTHEEQGSSKAPIVVHCAAGVGRTAVFATAYEQYLLWRSGGTVDIPKSVTVQRSPESGRFHRMVQAPEQYRLCYDTLRELVLRNKGGD
jgi:protein tyrosine phosphatase/predicted NAD-dependent protein-ADP-ribosyltransferase YbiA (DUF1768 family)